MRLPDSLNQLILLFRRLPSVGQKTAERFVFDMLDWDESTLAQFGQTILELKKSVGICADCGTFSDPQGCRFCQDTTRDSSLLCIVADPKDVFVIEDTRSFPGIFHVLGGLLSPKAKNQSLSVSKLIDRLEKHDVKEVILALDATLEGDITSLYLKDHLASRSIKLTRLAFGVPLGSSLDYVDGGTLAKSLLSRHPF